MILSVLMPVYNERETIEEILGSGREDKERFAQLAGRVTRKMKVLKKQKEGKKRMKSIGQVQIPQEAFMSILDSREK